MPNRTRPTPVRCLCDNFPMRRRRVICWLLLGACGNACRDPSWEPIGTDSVTKRDPSAALSGDEEIEFAQQVATVRAGRSDTIRVTKRAIPDREFAQLAGLTGLRQLILNRGRISDQSLATCQRLAALEHLRLRDSAITDRGIASLAAHANLKILNLPQADITDEGLQVLSQLPRLEYLRFASPRVTDRGLSHLTRLSTLRFLHLIGVNITDRGLKYVAQMKQLESFYLDGSHATDRGLTTLIQARPDLHLHRDQQHLDHDPNKHRHTEPSE